VTTGQQATASCAFCEGSGIWADSAGGPPDPCPLCDGSGRTGTNAELSAPTSADPVSLPRLLLVLREMSQADRQRLYEELHAVYDCRIYPR
jgi:hypothetical protein